MSGYPVGNQTHWDSPVVLDRASGRMTPWATNESFVPGNPALKVVNTRVPVDADSSCRVPCT